jgi:stage V sporulation protein B
MEKKKKSSDFLVQGSILAMASIISRIIGLIYRIPLTNIIGDGGNNIYAAAYDVYNILLLISSYSLPLAVSKLVAARLAVGEKKNANRVFKGALVFALTTGTIAFIIVFVFADAITKLLATPQSYLALKVLGPGLIIVAVMGVVRGYFQGMGTMVPSAISQIIEQIVNAIVSVIGAYYLFSYGSKVGAVVGNSQEYGEAFGAAGGTLGTVTGACASLLFLAVVYFSYSRTFKKGIRSDRYHKRESYSSIAKLLIVTIVPVLLSTTVYNISSIIDQGIFKNVALFQGYSASDISTWWGVFTGKYKVLTNVPIAIASAMAASCVPSITGAFSQKDEELVRTKISSSLRFIMLLAFPCMVGLCVLASPILQLLFHDARPLGATMIVVGGISIIFYSISTLSNAALQGIDRMSEPVKNAIFSLGLHIVVLLILMFVFHTNIYAVILANVFFSLIMCIFNSRSLYKYCGFKQEYKKTYVIPAIASALMGIVVFAVYKLVILALHSNTLATFVGILAGMLSYSIFITRLGGVTEEELKNFPKGGMIVKVLKKIRVL